MLARLFGSSLAIPLDMNRCTILVDGINDLALVSDIEKTIRETFDEMALPGAWRVTVKPSCVGGRWDLKVQGLNVRHTLSISVPPSLLPSLISRRLSESLSHSNSSNLTAVLPQRSILCA